MLEKERMMVVFGHKMYFRELRGVPSRWRAVRHVSMTGDVDLAISSSRTAGNNHGPGC